MGIQETNISKKIQMAACKVGGRLFRNNTGLFLSLDKQRKMYAGLGKGTSDLIGWTTITITPDMIGKKLAVFTAIEVKTETNRGRKKQKKFIAAVKGFGGFAGIARNDEDAIKILLTL